MWKDKWIHLNKLICSPITESCPHLHESLNICLSITPIKQKYAGIEGAWLLFLTYLVKKSFWSNSVDMCHFSYERQISPSYNLTKLYFSFFFSKYFLKSLFTRKTPCMSKYNTETFTCVRQLDLNIV